MTELITEPPAATRPARRTRRSSRRPRRDIQGLRAVAVLAVIANHLFAWPSGAFVGVDVFFVISGFLITGLLVKEYERSGHISARRFYRRRVKRIVPAATLVLLCTICASWVLDPAERFVATCWDALAAFLFVSNWRFAREGTDYFNLGTVPSPLQHYWSLSVEEQFYFTWPWLLLGLLVVGARWRGWDRSSTRPVAAITITVIIAGSFAWAMHQTSTAATSAYFSSLARVWELGVGAVLAIAAPRLAIPHVAVRTLLAYVGLAGIGVSLFVVPQSPGFPAPWAALPVLSTALVIAAGTHPKRQPYLWPLTNRAMKYVGNISYSLYLWHFPVIIMLGSVMVTGTANYYEVALALTAGLSVASFHLVEERTRRARWIKRRRHRRMPKLNPGWAQVAVVVAAILVVTFAAHVAYEIEQPMSSSDVVAAAGLEQGIESGTDEFACVGAGAMDPRHHCLLNDGDATAPSRSELIHDSAGAFLCWINRGDGFKVCHYGSDRPDAVRIALAGDSHAAMLLPALEPYLSQHNWSVDSVAGVSCHLWTVEETACRAQDDIRRRLMKGPPYDVLLTTGARFDKGSGLSTSDGAARYVDQWQPILDRGTKIIVVKDVPDPSARAISCVNRVNLAPTKDACATSEREAFKDSDYLAEAGNVLHLPVVDLTSLFCRHDECPGVIGNVIVYRDTAGHMSGTYAKTIGPYLIAKLEPLISRR